MAETTPKMGLAAWDQPLDPYNYQQLSNNWNIVDFHDHTPGRGVQIPFGGIAPGAVGTNQLTSDIQQRLVSGGATNIVPSESRTNTAYGTLTTPDQVTGVVLPTNGLIMVGYQATWQDSVAGAASAAIFIGANNLKYATNGGNGPQGASIGTDSGNTPTSLSTYTGGLVSNSGQFAYPGDATTGQVVGGQSGFGPCYIFAAAGTYTVSVQFKASSGSVTASNRKLWVWVRSF